MIGGFKDLFGNYTEIRANRVILSLASPVFKKQFFGSLKVKSEEPIDIVDGNADTFRDVIRFIYTEEQFKKYGKLETSGLLINLLDLSYFGHKYEITSLTSYTSFVINNNLVIDKNNVIPILQDIEHYKLNLESEYFIIRSKCFSFLDSNLDVIFNKTGSSDQLEINDRNFLPFATMYQLLKRKSLEISEFTVYKLLKEYVVCLVGKDEDIFKQEQSVILTRLFRELVDFSKCSLQQIDAVGEESWLPKEFLLEIAFKAIKMNVQQHLPILRRGLPGSILFPIGERFKNNKAFLTSTKFEIKFKVNKAAMLVLKQMHFQRFVFSQGGRTEIIPNEVSQKHLIYIEPELEVSISLMVKSPEQEATVDVVNNNLEMQGLGLKLSTSKIPTRFSTLEFISIDDEIEESLMKELQEFLDCFEKPKGKGFQFENSKLPSKFDFGAPSTLPPTKP